MFARADTEQEGVAALRKSLAELTLTLDERDEEVVELKKEVERRGAEANRLRRKLNDEYAKEASATLDVAASSQQQTVRLLEQTFEMRRHEATELQRKVYEQLNRRHDIERALLAQELGRLEARVNSLSEPLSNSLLGWLSLPAAVPPAAPVS